MKKNKKRNHWPWFDSRQGTKHGIVSQRPPIQTETAKLTKPTYKQFVYNLLGKMEYIIRGEKKGISFIMWAITRPTKTRTVHIQRQHVAT